MMAYSVEPLPGVVISNADENELSLLSFHLVIIVETESPFMYMRADALLFQEKFSQMLDLFSYELDSDCLRYDERPDLIDLEDTMFVWYPVGDPEFNRFKEMANMACVNASFVRWGSRFPDNLGYYLAGLAVDHPNWKVAVIGSILEDDVMQVANTSCSLGLNTTILGRYCFSHNDSASRN